MKVDIYQMLGEEPHIIIIKHGADLQNLVPKSLYNKIEKWGLVRNMNLSPSTTLVGVNAEDVMLHINEDGYFASIKSTSTSKSSSVGAGLGAGILAASLGLTPIGSIFAALIAGVLVAANTKEK